MSPDRFRTFFEDTPHRTMQKRDDYFGVYERHLGSLLGRPATFMEFGVSQGGSLDMWRATNAPGSLIIGVDTNPHHVRFEAESVRILVGDQGDPAFWRDALANLPTIDVVIDDGGHTMQQQVVTFESVSPHLDPHGIYLCEATHTPYADAYGGRRGRAGSFIELAKRSVDSLHAWHAYGDEELDGDDFARSTNSVHFYDGIVVFEPRPTSKPRVVERANEA